MRWIILYAATAIVLLPLDFLFLGTVGKKLFDDNVKDMVLGSPRMLGASPENGQHNILFGALFGFFCYST